MYVKNLVIMYDKLMSILLKTIIKFVLALRKSHEFKRNSF